MLYNCMQCVFSKSQCYIFLRNDMCSPCYRGQNYHFFLNLQPSSPSSIISSPIVAGEAPNQSPFPPVLPSLQSSKIPIPQSCYQKPHAISLCSLFPRCLWNENLQNPQVISLVLESPNFPQNLQQNFLKISPTFLKHETKP